MQLKISLFCFILQCRIPDVSQSLGQNHDLHCFFKIIYVYNIYRESYNQKEVFCRFKFVSTTKISVCYDINREYRLPDKSE